MGRSWYEDGKLLKKKNTFTDFIDCAEHLIEQKFTNREKLFASGASAGGLLMGAILNMRPDLFMGVIAGVPWVDVVTTMLDESIPLTTSEFDEWGNPKNKEYYEYMLSYSPYDNVQAVDYPNLLVTTGLHDSQVQYFEPAKWVARLRDRKTDDNLLILDTQMETGHGGASGRFKRYERTALQYAFLLELAGIKK
jgi:oligopeptidase B